MCVYVKSKLKNSQLAIKNILLTVNRFIIIFAMMKQKLAIIQLKFIEYILCIRHCSMNCGRYKEK